MKSLHLAAALALAVSLAGCDTTGHIDLGGLTGTPAATAPPTVIAPAPTPEQLAAARQEQVSKFQGYISATQFGLSAAGSVWTTFCLPQNAPKICKDAAAKVRIQQCVQDVNDALAAMNDGLAAYVTGGTSAAFNSAMSKASTALNDYNATVAAFRAGKPPPPLHTSQRSSPLPVAMAQTVRLAFATR
jgi:hypothetical protein